MSIEEQDGQRPLPLKVIIVAAVAVLGIGAYAINSVRNARMEANTVVARVNGEPIYKADLNRGRPSDSFDATLSAFTADKLSRMIAQIAIRQFLSKNGIKVNEALVDKEVKRLEANPPSQGCACCTYSSLDAYLSAMGYTRDDLRLNIRNSIGLSDYARKQWRKTHPTKEDQLREIGAHSKLIRERFINAWQIFFNTFQQPGYDMDPEKIRAEVGKKARAAWDRLQRGESFDAVAESVSEDMTSRRKGGALGSIDRSSYGQELDEAVSKLEPGEISKPIESSWGFHIIKWKPMTDDDVVKFCESYFVDKEVKNTYSRIMKDAKIERLEQPDSGG